jgi:DNA repair protein RecO (recombination protein O)
MRIEQCPAYILHSRPFKDTSVIIDCLSRQHGLVSLIAKGAKRPRSRLVGKLQPFILLSLSWVGRSELKTLTEVETQNLSPVLTGSKILLGFYLNELILRLLQKMDPHPQLFTDYSQTLEELTQATDKDNEQTVLRYFELKLLAELGYGLDLNMDGQSQEMIFPELLYAYDPAVGLFEAQGIGRASHEVVVSGGTLIALREKKTLTQTALKEAKGLMRFVLNHYLGEKPLQSRKLFQRVQVIS